MPSSLTSYLAGITTAGVAVVVGFGGALIMSTATPVKQPSFSRVERQAKAHESIAKNETEFPTRAEPIMTTPMPPVATVASELTQSALQNTGQRADSSTPPVINGTGISDKDDALQEHPTEPSVQPSIAAVISKKANPSPKFNQARQSSADVFAERQNETRSKRQRESAQGNQRRIEERKKQHEIAAATIAVRRMLRDRQDAREDVMQRPFNMGFSVD